VEVREGDLVLIYIDKRRKKLVKAIKGKVFGSDLGVLKLDDVIGKRYGESVEFSTGARAYILKPTLEDVLFSFKRRTQVIYPKDLGLMAIKLGAGPGKRCLEGGSGSGFVAATLSWFGCDVASFEVRKEHLYVAKRNLEEVGLRVTFVNASIGEAPEVYGEESFDAAAVDVGDPWKYVDGVWRALKGGAPAAFWLPTYNQLEKLKEASRGKFIWMESLEVNERRLKVEKGATRPEQTGITFTGFWAFLRKVY